MSTQLIDALNERLREHLTALGCRRGKFDSTGEGAPASLTGTRSDGRAVFKLAFARDFSRALMAYLEQAAPSTTAQLTIYIDLDADTFRYELTTHAAVARQAATDAQQEVERRRHAPRESTPYGLALAGQVADALQAGRSLGYGHRDYCGFGLEYVANHYRYGSIWDGVLNPECTFATRKAFITWLAKQSDTQLAQLEQAAPWLWDNQTLTRRRLQEFIAGY